MYRGEPEEETAFGQRRVMSDARRGVHVTARAVGSDQKRREEAVSRNFAWSDAGRAGMSSGVAVVCKVHRELIFGI